MSVIMHLDNMSGNNTSIEMQRDINYENKTCHNDEVPTKLQTERDIASEVPIRMNVVLRECSVVLPRLSEEQLHQFCHTEHIHEDVKYKTEELVNRTVAAVNESLDSHEDDFRTRNVRCASKLDFKAFQLYKQGRQVFLSKRKRAQLNFENTVDSKELDPDFSPDYSPDMSQDEEFISSVTSGRGRKRLKRGRKYEHDCEWSPYNSKNSIQSRRNLRRQKRRRVIVSDTSSSDEDDLLFHYFNEFNNDAASTDVPSQLDVNDTTASTTSSENGNSESHRSQNSSLNVSGNASSTLNTSNTSDIVSGIMRDMDQLNKGTKNLKSPLSVSVQKTSPQKNIKQPSQRGRRRYKFSPMFGKESNDENVDSIVSSILKEIVKTVCMEERRQQVKDKQLLKKCKWCHSQFPTSKSNQMYCPVCRDLGKGKLYSDNSPRTPKTQKSLKQTNGNNKIAKKVSNTMSRVMKILPKHERQRLLYAEKSSKLPKEKGYNHCRSFITPKVVESPAGDQKTSMEGSDTQLEKEHEKVNVEKKKANQGRKKHIDKSFSSAMESANTDCEKIQNEPIKSNKQGVKRCVKDTDKSVISKKHKTSSPGAAGNLSNFEENSGTSGKRKVSLKKSDDGLFLMTFPESDEELGTCTQKNTSQLGMQNKDSLKNSNKFNGSRATQIPDTNLVSSSNKSFQAMSSDEQYRTYFLPPVPTVVVANYSASHENNGDYRLSGIFYQNEYTQPLTNNSINPNTNPLGAASNVSALSSSDITYQNSCISNLQRNSAITLTTVSLNSGQNLAQPFTNNSSAVLNSLTVTAPNNKMTLLPVVSSVVSLSHKPSNLKETNSSHISNLHVMNNNFINSEQLQIKITHVSSEKNSENNSKAINSGSVPSNTGKEISINSVQSGNIQQLSENKGKSKENNAELSKPNKTAIESLNAIKTLTVSKVSVPKEKSSELKSPEHNNDNTASKKNIDNISQLEPTKFSDNNTQKDGMVQKENSLNNLKDTQQNLLAKEQTDQSNNLQQKQPLKTSNNAENGPVDSIKSAIDLLGAISILAILDLEKNPQVGLAARIQVAKSNLAKLQSEKNPTPDLHEKILSHQYNLQVLDIAKKFLNLHGSFAKVSDFLLRKQKMIQIKKELLTEEEEEEIQSSCRFSQRSQSTNSSANEGEFSSTSTMPSPASVKMENFSSCRLSEQALTVNHIEKMQSQIAAMNNSNLPNYDGSHIGSTVHHYPSDQIAALPPSVAAPTPVTPRNDCMGGESRETPSRGSGPRTPARPESATSQPEEQSLVQIKKELMEASGTSPSQCAYSQNTTLSQITSQMSVMPENQTLNMGHPLPNNPVQHISVNNNHPVISNDHTNLHVQPTINRTPAYNNNNPNYSNVLLNISSRNQVSPGIASGINSNMEQNRQVLIGQSLYIQNGTGLPPKQAVPSVNSNQYVIRSPFNNNNNGGTVVVSNSQVGGQNVSALLTNVSNQQFYTSNHQVSQLYYPPPSSQINCMQNNMPTPAVTVTQNQANNLGYDKRHFRVKKVYRLEHKIPGKTIFLFDVRPRSNEL